MIHLSLYQKLLSLVALFLLAPAQVLTSPESHFCDRVVRLEEKRTCEISDPSIKPIDTEFKLDKQVNI